MNTQIKISTVSKKMEAGAATVKKKSATATAATAAAAAAAASATAVGAPDNDCIVCCEPFNKSSHLPVECEHVSCKYKVCLECARSYLLNSINDPHCMECKANWSAKFMLILKKNWLSDIYRPHREKLLCDIEMSKMAETMPDAERYKAAKVQEGIANDIRKQYNAMKAELDKLSAKFNEAQRLTSQIRRGQNNPKEEKKEFFMPCPVVDCNGMLSTQYKCGICETFACPDCHEVIGLNKAEAEHTCDPNNVASALAIKKETKQCPGCHNRIFKTEGCSQMWCTGCHTAFDWTTGRKVVSERLHNPHYIEYQRKLNGGNAPRAPGDVPCGGICGRHQMQTHIINKLSPKKNTSYHIEESTIGTKIRYIHRVVENITLNDVRELRQKLQTLVDYKDQRIKFIVGEMTKDQLAVIIFRNDKLRQKSAELLNVFELLSVVGIDFFNRLIANIKTGEEFEQEVIDQIAQFDKMRIYCNELFAVISNTYGMTVPQLTDNWVRITDKFNNKTLSKAHQHALALAEEGSAAQASAAPASAQASAAPAQASAAPASVVSGL